MRIMVDGYNLSLEKGTGISTYARNLTRINRVLGNEVSVLYGKSGLQSHEPFLNEIGFFDTSHAPRRPTSHPLHKLHRLQQLINAALGKTEARKIPLSGKVDTREYAGRLPCFDHLYNASDLFILAHMFFRLTGRLLELSVDNPPDIMHWTYPVPVRLRGARNIYTLHDMVPLKLPYTTLDHKPTYYRMCRKIADTADRIVTVSEHSREDICRILGLPESFVVNTYQSVEIPEALSKDSDDALSTILENMFSLRRDGYILFVGAIEPKKNVRRLLEAYLQSGIELPLVMVGPRAWMADQELALLNEENQFRTVGEGLHQKKVKRVRFLDYVSFPALVKLIRGARFLVFPSLYEGFGLPVLEAMSLGTPVLTSSTSCLPEVTDGAAALVNPYDVDAIREGLIAMASRDLSDYRAAGLRRAADFCESTISENLRALYDDVLSGGQGCGH